MFGADRIFHYNSLHDYESTWWIAVWFVFCCRPEGTTEEEMRKARDAVYESRAAIRRLVRTRSGPPVGYYQEFFDPSVLFWWR